MHVVTDVLDLDLSLQGGDIVRADLPRYPRDKSPGIWLMSLKSWKAQQVSTQEGESLNWAALPPVPGAP